MVKFKKIISLHAYPTGTCILQKRWEISWRFQICPRFLQEIRFKRDKGFLKVYLEKTFSFAKIQEFQSGKKQQSKKLNPAEIVI